MYIIAWQKSGSVRDFPTEQQEGKPGTEGKGRGSVGRAVAGDTERKRNFKMNQKSCYHVEE